MSDAKSIADTRLAKGEITADEHAAIVTAMNTGSRSQQANKSNDTIPEPSKLMWGLALAGAAGGALVFKISADELGAEGRAVNWTLFNIIFFFCALTAIVAISNLAKKEK